MMSWHSFIGCDHKRIGDYPPRIFGIIEGFHDFVYSFMIQQDSDLLKNVVITDNRSRQLLDKGEINNRIIICNITFSVSFLQHCR